MQIICGNQLKMNIIPVADEGKGRGRTVQMAVIAAPDLFIAQHAEQFFTALIQRQRRIMQKANQLSAERFAGVDGHLQSPIFTQQHFFVRIGFRVVKPAAGADDRVIAEPVGIVEQNL